MTRKKFVKMLMGHGISRGTANQLARDAKAEGKPYFEALGDILNFWNILGWAARKMAIDCLIYGYAEMPTFARLNLCPHITEPVIVTSYTPNIQDGIVGRSILDSLLERDCEERSQWPKENPHIQGGGGHA